MITQERLINFYYDNDMYPYESPSIEKGIITSCYINSASFSGCVDNCMQGLNRVSPFILSLLKKAAK